MSKSCARRIVLTIVLFPAVAAAQILNPSRFEPLGTLSDDGSGTLSVPRALSANGRVVVGESSGDAFKWTLADGMSRVFAIEAPREIATDVSGDGARVAGFSFWSETKVRAWRIDMPSGSADVLTAATAANGISANGQVIVGEQASPLPAMAFTWWVNSADVKEFANEASYYESPQRLSNTGSIVVGYRFPNNNQNAVRPIRWRRGLLGSVQTEPLGDLAGGSVGGEALAVSGNGNVIVGWSYGPNGKAAVAWIVSNSAVALGSLSGWTQSEATAVSLDGYVTAGKATTSAGSEAFVWTLESGLLRLRSVFLAHNLGTSLTGWRISSVAGVSTDASFVYFAGTGVNPNGDIEGWWARVKKPL